ncbi:MAG TPA: hypothetical protein VGO67_12560 [Verrucomicrobiae bacterium]
MKNNQVQPLSVTVGKGEAWELERVQSSSPEALEARAKVEQGAELSRVVSRADQATDGAQPWSLIDRGEVEKMGSAEFNQTVGAAGPVAKESGRLEPPVLLTGRMPSDGAFVTTPALKEYGSSEKLPAMEVVAAPDTVTTTGAYDLSHNPTMSSLYPPELKTNNPQTKENAMFSQSNHSEPTTSAPSAASSGTPPTPPPPDLGNASFGAESKEIATKYAEQNPQPSAMAQEVAAAHSAPEPAPSTPAPSPAPESPSC